MLGWLRVVGSVVGSIGCGGVVGSWVCRIGVVVLVGLRLASRAGCRLGGECESESVVVALVAVVLAALWWLVDAAGWWLELCTEVWVGH